jgi:hypothetical protein
MVANSLDPSDSLFEAAVQLDYYFERPDADLSLRPEGDKLIAELRSMATRLESKGA